MKKIKLFLFALVLVGLVVSCAENPGTTTMKLYLSTSQEEGGRTILPSDSTLMDVTKYVISGVGPNGKTFTVNTQQTSVSVEGLTIGDWTVTAKGLNKNNTVLVSGSKTFRLTSTATPQTIVLSNLVGSGNFSFTLDWHLCDVADPHMEVFLAGPDVNSDEVSLDVTLNNQTKKATVTETLAAGSYKIRVILKDGSHKVAGLVEAVRISNGATTSGEHIFHFSELGPSTLMYLRDATGTPIKGSLSVSNTPDTFLSGNDYTYVFSFTEPNNVNTEGLTIDWYYDGVHYGNTSSLTATGSSVTITAENGVHRVDAVVYNKLVGSTGSAAYTFTVVPDGEVGEMMLLSENAATAITTIDSRTMISPLPNNHFLVVTPNSAKMYVCGVSSGVLQVLKTYEASNFAWLQNTKHIWSSDKMNVIIASDNKNGTENITTMIFNSTNKTITPVSGMRFEGKIPAYNIPFTNFTSVTFNPTKNIIYLSDSGANGYDYFFRVTDATTVTTGGLSRKKAATYYNVADSDSAPDGGYYIYCSLSAPTFISAKLSDTGAVSASYISQSSGSAISKIKYINSQTVVASNSYELTTFKTVASNSFTKYKTIEIAAVDIVADGSNYFYVADNSNRLVSFSVTGYEVTQLGDTTLTKQITKLCLSGKYLAAITSSNTIAMFEVIAND